MAERSKVMEQQAGQDAYPAYTVEAGTASAEGVLPGYKRTEVGVIPEDWQIVPLEEHGKAYGGLTGKTGEDFGVGRAKYVPFLGVMKCYVLDASCLEAVRVASKEAQNPVREGDILFTSSSETPEEVAMPALVGFNLPDVYLNSFCFGYTLNDRAPFHRNFLVYLIRSDIGRQVVAPLAQGSTRHNISKRVLLRAPLPCPPLEEQRAITIALSDADALIESLDRLIAKKRAIKQAAMQQLLTGQTRLPGFTGEWETKRLGELLTVRHGRNQSEIEKYDGRYPILATGGEIGRTDTPLYERPSVLIGRKGTIDEPRFMDSPFWTVDTLFYTEINETANPKFIFYIFQRIPWRDYNEASGVPSLNGKTIEAIQVSVPNLKEQTAIATVLSDMDTEIEGLERRRDKARQIKQGMMQQLLTGRVRLVAPQTMEPAAC